VQNVGLCVSVSAAASEDGEPATLDLEGLPVGLADQSCHPLHAAVNHIIDVGSSERPLPVACYLIVDFNGSEAHDLVTSHARVPDNAKVTEGHRLKARLKQVERPVEGIRNFGFAGAIDLLVGSVKAGESSVRVFSNLSRMDKE